MESDMCEERGGKKKKKYIDIFFHVFISSARVITECLDLATKSTGIHQSLLLKEKPLSRKVRYNGSVYLV